MNTKITLIAIVALFATTATFAQVGIGTTDPKASLDVVGEPTVTTSLDGVIPPRISKADLGAKTYTAEQNGALVFVDEVNASAANQVSEVFDKGYHYFDAPNDRWYAVTNYTKPIGGGTSGTVNDAITTPQTIQSSGNTASEEILTTRTFTLTRKSLVNFESLVTAGALKNAAGNNLEDGKIKLMRTMFRFTIFESAASTLVLFNTTTPVTNSATGGGYAAGFYRLAGSKKLILEPGNYTVNLIGGVFAADADGISLTFGGGVDVFDIFATPVE